MIYQNKLEQVATIMNKESQRNDALILSRNWFFYSGSDTREHFSMSRLSVLTLKGA